MIELTRSQISSFGFLYSITSYSQLQLLELIFLFIFLIFWVAVLIGESVFLINIHKNKVIKRITTKFVIKILKINLFIKIASGESGFENASRTFLKLSVGIISSIYFGVSQLFIK